MDNINIVYSIDHCIIDVLFDVLRKEYDEGNYFIDWENETAYINLFKKIERPAEFININWGFNT